MSGPNVDILLISALTEEQQVVHAVLGRRAKLCEELDDSPCRVTVYEHGGPASELKCAIATACMHDMGGVPMGVFASTLFSKGIRPACAVLVGIAATLKRDDIDLADVVVAAAIFSSDDIKVEAGSLTFRTQGYPVDHEMRMAAGALRERSASHGNWTRDCKNLVHEVIAEFDLTPEIWPTTCDAYRRSSRWVERADFPRHKSLLWSERRKPERSSASSHARTV